MRLLPNLAPGDRRAVLIGAVAAAPIALWMLVAAPYLHALRETRAKLETSRDLLARERRLLAGAKQYPRALEQGKAGLAAVSGRLLEGEAGSAAGAALATHLRRHAAASRVLLSELKFAPAESAGEGVTAVSLHVTGESDLEGLLTFLRALESGTTLVHVDQLEIQSVQPSTSESAPDPGGGAVPGGPEVLSFQLAARGFALMAHARAAAPR